MPHITPAFLILLIILCFSMFAVQRHHMIVPIVIAMCFMPADIAIEIVTLDFSALRILLFAGFLRLLISPQKEKIEANMIDYLVIFQQLTSACCYILASDPKSAAIIYKSGALVDSLLLYYILRHVIKDSRDINLLIKTFAFCILFLLPFAAYEYYSASNLFSILGRDAISMRSGEVRVACTFSHAILFGSFVAAITPLFFADISLKKKLWWKIVILSCFFFVFVSGSSGPIIALAGGLFYTFFFRWRQHSKKLFWLTIFSAVFIHLAREGSLWGFIYTRITPNASSTGYHRYLVVEAAIKEFHEWWLLGYGNHALQWHTKYWPGAHATFTDITNQYILEGVRGGFLAMTLFIVLCYQSVKALGKRANVAKSSDQQKLYWGVAVMLLVHCITFLSVSYFGQIIMLFYLSIAIAALALEETKRQLT